MASSTQAAATVAIDDEAGEVADPAQMRGRCDRGAVAREHRVAGVAGGGGDEQVGGGGDCRGGGLERQRFDAAGFGTVGRAAGAADAPARRGGGAGDGSAAVAETEDQEVPLTIHVIRLAELANRRQSVRCPR